MLQHSGSGSSTSSLVNPFAPPSTAVSFTVTWPTTVQAVYRFYSGAGGTGTLLKTVTINFTVAQTPDVLSGDIV